MAGARIVQIVPLGHVPYQPLIAAAVTIRARFDCQPVIVAPVAIPPAARRPDRRQLDADLLLELLFDRLTLDTCRIIGITADDTFAEGRNFVFGYAHMRDRVAMVSTARLTAGAHLEKAIVHELGHTFHAPHCPHPRCVMHQVEHLFQLEGLDSDMCLACTMRVRAVVEQSLDSAESLFDLAGSYMRRRRHAKAATAYQAASDRDPDNPHYANDLGVALLALGERAEALAAFRRAIMLDPTYPHAYYNLGIIFRERGDVGTADGLFAAAIERDGDLRSAHRYLGILHQDYFQDPPRARAYLERYVALGGTDGEVRRRLRQLTRRGMDELAMNSRRLIIESTAPV
jgi:predicted Zn-dependent protease